MRASQLTKLFLGPVLATAFTTVASATPHEASVDSSTVVQVIVLLSLLALSIGTLLWTRRERRRYRRYNED